MLFGGALHTHYRIGNVVERTKIVDTIVESLSIKQEYDVLHCLTGVKCPDVYSLKHNTIYMQYMQGATHKVINHVQAKKLAYALADIHKCSAPKTLPYTPIHKRIELYVSVLQEANMLYPAMAYYAQWLKDNTPKQESCLVHGDYRLGNILYNQNEVEAVLDWEFSHMGNRAEDLGWMLSDVWDGDANERVILNAYMSTTKKDISIDELEYWKVFAHLRFSAIACQQYYRGVLEKDIELVVTGWRIMGCETRLQNRLTKDDRALINKNNNDCKYPSKKHFLATIFPSLCKVLKGKKDKSQYLNDLKLGCFLFFKKYHKMNR